MRVQSCTVGISITMDVPASELTQLFCRAVQANTCGAEKSLKPQAVRIYNDTAQNNMTIVSTLYI